MKTRYIALIWKYDGFKTYPVSREEESLKQFRERIEEAYPFKYDYHIEYVEGHVVY